MTMAEQHAKPPLLEVNNLSLTFHKGQQTAVDRVSFSIKAGSSVGLVGASGAGKSSVARAILQLVKPDSGEILFKGKNIGLMDPRALKSARQSIQMVFQDPSVSLSPKRTVEQTLVEPLQHFEIGDANSRPEKALQILRTVGLDQSAMHRYPHQFSSGQQQRIAIARALVTNPELLIADEAVASLDVSVQAQILRLIQSLQDDYGITFLFISHDLAVIRQIASEVAVIYRGQLVEQSPADRFFSQPAHPYSRTLLSFAKGKTPPGWTGDKWHLHRGQRPPGESSGCVFAAFCPDKMPQCESTEPLLYAFQAKNQHAKGLQRVKCHLYDEVNNHDH